MATTLNLYESYNQPLLELTHNRSGTTFLIQDNCDVFLPKIDGDMSFFSFANQGMGGINIHAHTEDSGIEGGGQNGTIINLDLSTSVTLCSHNSKWKIVNGYGNITV